MKKKYFALSLAAALCITATACGAGSDSGTSSSAPSAPASSAASTSSAPSSAPSDTSDGPSFADNVLTMDDYTITITDYKMIRPGEEGNKYGDKPVIAFWYDTTNISHDKLNPSTAWILVFEAIQDNDPNLVNTLSMGLLPDDRFLESQTQDIKVGGTVSNAVAYKLDDDTTPVTLVAENVLGGEYGRQEFSLAS